MKKAIIGLGISCLLVGCISAPTTTEVNDVKKRLKMPDNYKENVKSKMNQILLDSESARVQFLNDRFYCAIYKGIQNNGGFSWNVCTTVLINAKNRMGGYTGQQTYEYCVNDSFILIDLLSNLQCGWNPNFQFKYPY